MGNFIKKHLNLDNELAFAILVHSLYVAFYFITLPTYAFPFHTPFGRASMATFPVVFANLVVLIIAKRLGFLQGWAVILTSFALAQSIHYSGSTEDVIWTSAADAVQLAVAVLLFKYGKSLVKAKHLFIFAAWVCGGVAALTYELGVGIYSIQRFSSVMFLETAMLAVIYVLIDVWEHLRNEYITKEGEQP